MAEERTEGDSRGGCVRLVIGGLTPETRRALETAIRLATEIGDGIDCVFVEETGLFIAASLPIAREVAVVTGRVQRFDPLALALALRRQATDTQRLLAKAALRARLRWNFEVVRGALLAEALRRAGEDDVIVIAMTGGRADAPLRELQRDALAALVDQPEWQLRRLGGTLVARPKPRER